MTHLGRLLLVCSAFAGGFLGIAPLNGQTIGPPIRATESLRISGEENDLAALRWVVAMPAGRIVAGLAGEGVIKWFDAHGKFLGSSARRGEGPGEFRVMGAAGHIGDTLWVLDGALSRVSFFAPGPARTPKVATSLVPTRIASAGTQGLPVVGSVLALLSGRGLLFHGTEPTDPATGVRGFRRLVLTDSVGQIRRILPSFAPRDHCTVPYTTSNGMGSVGIYFCAQPIISVSQASDRFAVVTSDNSGSKESSFDVRLYSSEGRLLLNQTLRVPARLIPKQLADSIQRSSIEGARSSEERAARRGARIPTAFPPLVDVVLSDDGATWLGLSTDATYRTWIVLGAGGVRGRDVILPKRFRPMTVVGGEILGIELDDNEFIDIVRYRVR